MKKNILYSLGFLCFGLILGVIVALSIRAIQMKYFDKTELVSENMTYPGTSEVGDLSDVANNSEGESLTGWLDDLIWADTDLQFDLWLPDQITIAQETSAPYYDTSGAWGLEVEDYSYSDFMEQYGYENNFYGFDGIIYGSERQVYSWKDPDSKVAFELPSAGGDFLGAEYIAQNEKYQIVRMQCKRSFLEEPVFYELWVIIWEEPRYYLMIPVDCVSQEEIEQIASQSGDKDTEPE